jgi:hypothetical protein
MSVSCECCVLSGRGLCVELVPRPEESYRVWCVWVWSWSLEKWGGQGPQGAVEPLEKKMVIQSGAEPTDAFQMTLCPTMEDRGQSLQTEKQMKSCHCETCSLTVDRWIMQRVNERRRTLHVSVIPWPLQSPDLTVLDFFLWGHLKECVYKNRPHTIQELKRAIRDEIATISCCADVLTVLWIV